MRSTWDPTSWRCGKPIRTPWTYSNVIPSILLEESYDTNERLAEQVSLDVPAGHEIYEVRRSSCRVAPTR